VAAKQQKPMPVHSVKPQQPVAAKSQKPRQHAKSVPDLMIDTHRAPEPSVRSPVSAQPVAAPEPKPARPLRQPRALDSRAPRPPARDTAARGAPEEYLLGNTVSGFDDDEPNDHRIAIDTDGRRESTSLRGASSTAMSSVRGPAVSARVPLGVRASPILDFMLPLKLVGAGVVLMSLDWIYHQLTGELVAIGPARTMWLAGPLVIAGLILLLNRLIQSGD
jgi:hypothetical protein